MEQDLLWQTKTKTNADRLLHLYNTKQFADVTFTIKADGECSDRIVNAHSQLLAMHSSVFETMLFGELVVTKSDYKVTIDDIEPSTFDLLLRYIYTSKWVGLETNTLEAVKLYVASDKYMMNALKSSCWDYILSHAQLQEALEILQHARTVGNYPMTKVILDLISKIFVPISKTFGFIWLEPGQFKTLLFECELELHDIVILMACLKWCSQRLRVNSKPLVGEARAAKLKQLLRELELPPDLNFNRITHSGMCSVYKAFPFIQTPECFGVLSEFFKEQDPVAIPSPVALQRDACGKHSICLPALVDLSSDGDGRLDKARDCALELQVESDHDLVVLGFGTKMTYDMSVLLRAPEADRRICVAKTGMDSSAAIELLFDEEVVVKKGVKYHFFLTAKKNPGLCSRLLICYDIDVLELPEMHGITFHVFGKWISDLSVLYRLKPDTN